MYLGAYPQTDSLTNFVVAGSQAGAVVNAPIALFDSRYVPSNGNVGFYGVTAQAKQTVTGAKAGNAALTSLMSKLVLIGLFTDGTS